MALQPDKRTPTILLAEDDVLMRLALAEFLRGCGYRVLEARSAEEAIAERRCFELAPPGGRTRRELPRPPR